MSSFLSMLKCTHCGKEYSPQAYLPTCPGCGGVLNATYSPDRLKEHVSKAELERRVPGVWKYFEFLPLHSKSSMISLGEGGTFLHKCERLAEAVGLRNLYIKDETSNPTGSFIDRGTTVEVSRIGELGRKSVYCGLTGNLAASLVAYTARAGLKCKVFIPERLDTGKFYQIIAYGADVEVARDSADACGQAYKLAEQEKNVSHFVMPYNLYFQEGEKTTGYEICEQLDWTLPDEIIVPMGSGGHISMIWKGINEFHDMGFLKHKATKIIGTQAQGCAPIVEAVRKGQSKVTPAKKTSTIAIDICVKDPPCGGMALQAIGESRGTAVSVPDSEIVEAVRILAKLEGIFAEPAAATTIAGLKRLVDAGEIDSSETVVCVVTGMGLKYPEVAKTLVKGSRKLEELLRRVERRKYTTELGETKMRILKIVSRKESYGYEVWKILKEEFGVSVKIPSVYQHLSELESAGLLIQSRSEQTLQKTERNFYKLTERGRSALVQIGKLTA